jgi:hypothetical protein
MIVPHVTLTGTDKNISDISKKLGQGYTEPGIDHKTTEYAELLQLAANQSDNGLSQQNGYTGHWEAPDHPLPKLDNLPYAAQKARKYAQAYQIALYGG